MRTPLLAVILAALVLGPPARGAPTADLPDRPLTLEDCAAIALRSNPQMVSSRQRIVSARAGVTTSRSGYYPQVSLSAVEGLTNGGAGASSGADTREELDLSLRMTFWQQGRRAGVQQSRASLRAADLTHASTTQSLVEQVAGDYYGVLAARQLLAVAEEGVTLAQDHLEEVKARIAAGAEAEVDVFSVEDDLAQAQLDAIDARSSVRLAFATLKNSMGLPPGTQLELAQAPPPGEEAVPALQEAIATALENRPDLFASRASVEASGYALAQAKIERGPVADVSGQYSHQTTQWEDSDSSWDLLLSVSWPLFDGHAAEAAETSARAALKQQEADLEALGNEIALQVESALVEVERTRERLQASQVSVAAAEARLAAAEGKYRQNVGILLEVTDARASVTSARATQVQARYDAQIALVGLKRVLGTLAVPAATEPTP